MNPHSDGEWLACSCCGNGVRNLPGENVSYGDVPYPHDQGVGLCPDCGGDASVPAEDRSEAADRKRLGWATAAFVDHRIPVVREGLNPENRKRFEALPYHQKANVIFKMVERRVLSW